MGGVGRRMLFNLRNALFNKLQELPVAFFNQNSAGDLISRINNDTDKLNQFFAQALMQFLGNAVLIVGAGILLVALNIELGLAALVPAVLVLIITQLIGGWVKRASFKSLQTLGGLSGEIQESLTNFKVIVAFNRLDYFRNKFAEANSANYRASIRAGIASNIFIPIYGLAFNLGQLIVLCFGLWLISASALTTGLLIGYLLYVNNFYNPLRQLAAIWSSLQLALAGLDRISEVLALSSDMTIIPLAPKPSRIAVMAFDNVSFDYPDGEEVLKSVSFSLERGKTYALVGPDRRRQDDDCLAHGAALRSDRGHRAARRPRHPLLRARRARRKDRLYPAGAVPLHRHRPRQHPLRQFAPCGSIRRGVRKTLADAGLSGLLARFDQGLDTPVTSSRRRHEPRPEATAGLHARGAAQARAADPR